MPTTLPRHSVSFSRETDEVLESLAQTQGIPVSKLIVEMVSAALEFMEDFELARIGEERLRTFDRQKALTTEQLIAWNNSRKKK